MLTVHQLAPLISLTVTLLVFCLLLTCLMLRPSARRTILLTTPLGEKEKKSKRKKSPKQENVNPIYMWMVQPKEETGLKEGNQSAIVNIYDSRNNLGRFTLARSSQKTFTLDRENLRRSSSLYTESSGGNLSRASSMSTSTSFLSRTDSVCTRTSSLSDGDYDQALTQGGGRKGSGDGQAATGGGRSSFLYNFLKQGKHQA